MSDPNDILDYDADVEDTTTPDYTAEDAEEEYE